MDPDLLLTEELEDAGCAHRGSNQRFGPRVRRALLLEAEDANGIPTCMYPECPQWRVLRLHHIHPSWADGSNTADNGIVLCANHHDDADHGVVTPTELRAFKQLRPRSLPPIISPSRIEHLLYECSCPDARQGEPCDMVYFRGITELRDLRRCHPKTRTGLKSARRALAATQLRMAGALCAWLPADLLRRRDSERFEIDLHARHALSLANRLAEHELAMRAHHALAVNASAQHDITCAHAHALSTEALRSRLTISDIAYHAYLTRDLAALFARSRDFSRAHGLLDLSANVVRKAGVSDGAETWMRTAQVLMLEGNVSRAARLIEADACRSVELTPIQTVIRIRIQAAVESLTGNVSASASHLSCALSIAKQHSLGHQRAKIEAAFLRLGRTSIDS